MYHSLDELMEDRSADSESYSIENHGCFADKEEGGCCAEEESLAGEGSCA